MTLNKEASMKKSLVVLMILVLLAAPAFAQWRIDVGAIVPRGAGLSIGGSTETMIGGVDMESWPFIPLPEAGLYYTGALGPLTLGIGARAFTLIVETFLWPNAFAELNFGPLALQAQFGGGFFAMFGIITAAEFGQVFIPDLSAWFKIGKKGNLRLGGGLVGLYMPEITDTDAIPFLYYLGGKVAIQL
jgi:hypothetical protein